MKTKFLPLILVILFFIFPRPISAQHPTATAQLLNTIETSRFSPPSPDPAGITYITARQKFVISDSEVDEMPIFADKNVFEYPAASSSVNGIYSTLSFSTEPTGISYDPVANLYFFSDDDKDQITKINPGQDNILGTSDDSATFFKTNTFGCTDAEGVFAKDGKIYIAGGIDRKIFITDYSGNLLSTINVDQFGINDFEGITLNPQSGRIFILSRNPKMIVETNVSGAWLREISITSLQSVAPADLVFAPSSNPNDDPSLLNLYIVDRMVDNNSNPSENDGRIYEISIPVTSSPTITPTLPPSNLKPGDANGDGKIDGIDYVIWLNNYNKNVSTGPTAGDFDRNGFVDGIDYVIWLNNYGK